MTIEQGVEQIREPGPSEAARKEQGDALRRVAIVGVANSGKTALFERLSRSRPSAAFATFEVQQAEATLGHERVILIDTPGLSGLELCSEDEAPTRALLRDTPPDVILQAVDATNLTRSLLLTAQLADLGVPILVCLNKVDEAFDRGTTIDAEALAAALGVPVTAACAADGRGVARLRECFGDASEPVGARYPGHIEEHLREPESRSASLLALVHDQRPGSRAIDGILEEHRHWAERITGRVVRKTGLEAAETTWDWLSGAALHPLGAWVFLLGTALLVYWLIAEVGVGLLAAGFERTVIDPLTSFISGLTGPGLLHNILIGPYGLLSLGLLNALGTVLPILLVYYFLFGFLEDIGYFPLLAVQFDRLLRWVGLTGKAVLPITLGFGCNSVATMATRSLETPEQRFIACFLISLGIPCAVQLGVMVAVLATLPISMAVLLVLIVLTVQGLAGGILARILPRTERAELLLELPPIRRPQLGNVFRRTWFRVREFFIEACPLFLASAALLLVLQYTGLLAVIEKALEPLLVRGLGLPREFAECLLMTLARREVGATMMLDLVGRGMLDAHQAFVGLLVMTLFVPCMSNTLIMAKVVGTFRTVVIYLAVIAIALLVGVATHGLMG